MNMGQYVRSAEGKKRKISANIVPFFSWRSILSLALGLVLGAALGLGYYYASPLVNPASNQVWISDVQIQVVNPTTTYMDVRSLQNRMEYYIAKIQSWPCLEFLSQKISEEEPQYHHTAAELAGMINIEYSSTSATDTAFKIILTTPTPEETAFLIVRIPELFKSYLIAEEIDKQQQQYEATLGAIETTKVALFKAQQELEALAQEGIASDIKNDPAYVILNAKVTALQAQLDKLTPGLADIIAQGTDNSEYANSVMDAIEKTNTALIEAQKELAILEIQWTNDSSSLSLNYQLAQDKVKNLNKQLISLSEKRDSLLVSNIDTSRITDYLVITHASVPAPPASLKLNATILVGALVGIVVAWVVLNFKWFTKETYTSPEEEDKV